MASERIACILLGGPVYWIDCGGDVVPFELHPDFGPAPVSKNNLAQPLKTIPRGFWDAWERFDLGGRRLDGQRCVLPAWCTVCKGTGDEVRQLLGNHYELVGRCQVCAGKKVVFDG